MFFIVSPFRDKGSNIFKHVFYFHVKKKTLNLSKHLHKRQRKEAELKRKKRFCWLAPTQQDTLTKTHTEQHLSCKWLFCQSDRWLCAPSSLCPRHVSGQDKLRVPLGLFFLLLNLSGGTMGAAAAALCLSVSRQKTSPHGLTHSCAE